MQSNDTTATTTATPEELVSQIMRAVQAHIAIHSAAELQAKLLGIVAPGHEAMNESNQVVAPDQMRLDLDDALGIVRPAKPGQDGPIYSAAQGLPSLEVGKDLANIEKPENPQSHAEKPHRHAVFAANVMFLNWNRSQEEPLVKIAYEYGVLQKAVALYFEALEKVKIDEANGRYLKLAVDRDII